MAYTKVNFADGTTPLDATNLGKLDDALADQDERIDANSDLIDSLGGKYFTFRDTSVAPLTLLQNNWDSLPNQTFCSGILIGTQRAGFIAYRYNYADGYGAALIINYSYTPPIRLVKISNGTWFIYSLTGTEV